LNQIDQQEKGSIEVELPGKLLRHERGLGRAALYLFVGGLDGSVFRVRFGLGQVKTR